MNDGGDNIIEGGMRAKHSIPVRVVGSFLSP